MARRVLEFSHEEEDRRKREEQEPRHEEEEEPRHEEEDEDMADHSLSLSEPKRLAECDMKRESKKAKPSYGGGEEEATEKIKRKPNQGGGEEEAVEKKFPPPFTRIFNDKDEIVLLKGMRKFPANIDFPSLFGYVKERLSIDVSESQLKEKCRRLKEKYSKNIKKGKDVRDFTNHDLKVFKLSKKVWGHVSCAGTVEKSVEEEKEGVAVERKDFAQLYPFLSLSLKGDELSMMSMDVFAAMKSRLELMDKFVLDGLESEWKNQILKEAQVKLRRVALLEKQVKLLS